MPVVRGCAAAGPQRSTAVSGDTADVATDGRFWLVEGRRKTSF